MNLQITCRDWVSLFRDYDLIGIAYDEKKRFLALLAYKEIFGRYTSFGEEFCVELTEDLSRDPKIENVTDVSIEISRRRTHDDDDFSFLIDYLQFPDCRDLNLEIIITPDQFKIDISEQEK